jgi:hypothetical protein
VWGEGSERWAVQCVRSGECKYSKLLCSVIKCSAVQCSVAYQMPCCTSMSSVNGIGSVDENR